MKKRLDIQVQEKENISLKKAQALIMSGAVFVDGERCDKAGTIFEESADIEVKKSFPYVSRGALKIKEAVEEFKIDLEDKTIADIGASTGGFTDFVLQNGAKKVYAIDTGKGQIAEKLRRDKRVILYENTNIKEVDKLPEKIDYFLVDVSFISLRQVFPALKRINDKASIVALVKPQFEVDKKIADKARGIIKDENVQMETVHAIGKFAEELGYKVKAITKSPITGAKGNKEFLIYLSI